MTVKTRTDTKRAFEIIYDKKSSSEEIQKVIDSLEDDEKSLLSVLSNIRTLHSDAKLKLAEALLEER
ncbi:MAG: hypothetical protein ACE5F2_00580 [Candidatus Paceibacteria bacterium]